MARVTIEDCLEKVDNRFSLVHLAARRVRQIRSGSPVMSDRDNKDVVLALREIASGAITQDNIDEYDRQDEDELQLSDAKDGAEDDIE
ncbi:MAG: DNA-directed RNA polymerase subunit omega [Deltaproteobacteria bacterium]|nr:DNA-directed RNA polymerase subunit omega [Deltaproteobacteria bacterium]MBW2085267.1 DNA-directed RNA polymerase subunit omega [Deltaproteobacteria bacterium]